MKDEVRIPARYFTTERLVRPWVILRPARPGELLTRGLPAEVADALYRWLEDCRGTDEPDTPIIVEGGK